MASTREHPNRPGVWQVRVFYRGLAGDFVFESVGKQTARQVAEGVAKRFDERVALIRQGILTIPLEVQGRAVLRFLLGDTTTTKPVVNEKRKASFESLVQAYLEHRQTQVSIGELSPTSFDSDKRRLAKLQAFAKRNGKGALEGVVNADFLGEYRRWVFKQVKAGKRGPTDAKHLLRTAKALVLWGYEQERVDALPRNLRTYANVKLPPPKPKTFTKAQVKALLSESSPLMRACIMLGLNAGFTQIDVATLLQEHLDFDSRLLSRNRNKTDVPCQYRLWPSTIEAIRAVQSTEGPNVFRTRQGHPLVHDAVKPDGTYTKSDSITQAFRRLSRRLGIGLTFKHLRKTAAQAIENENPNAPHLVDLFLAHAAPGMRKHYTQACFTALHEALDRLGEHFDLA